MPLRAFCQPGGMLAAVVVLALACSVPAGVVSIDTADGGSVLPREDAGSNVVRADTVPDRSVRSTPAFRAFWADAFSQGFKSTSQINDMISRAQSGNYNAIVAEVLAYHDNSGGGHGAYWHSSIVPWAGEVTAGFDPLEYLVQQAHTAGIEVHAWLVPYRVCTSWPPSGNSEVQASWLMVPQADMGGGPATVDGKYTLDPGSPDVQEYIISIVRELVTDYEIDGINWDYIRYTSTDAGYPADTGYADSSLARFQDITGYVGTPGPSESSWSDFRRQTINELVRRARAEIAAIDTNPRQPLRHTADLFAAGSAPASFANSTAYARFQNWRHWMEMGWLDAGMPMNYKREHCTDEATWYRSWIDAAVGWRYDRHMYCGQAAYLNSMANSVTQLNYGYGAGADGSVNYSYVGTRATETICDENDDWVTDWTWYTYVSSNIFTSSVSTPTMPWRDPATATEGTLWGQVTDPQSGDPVDDATVTVDGFTAVQTDGNGYYVVTLIPADEFGTSYTITATKEEYPNRVHYVDVFAGDVVRQDIVFDSYPGDYDFDGDVDIADYLWFQYCLLGPGHTYTVGHDCLPGDTDEDMDVDLEDFVEFQRVFVGG